MREHSAASWLVIPQMRAAARPAVQQTCSAIRLSSSPSAIKQAHVARAAIS
jgi:hypothetical protein